MTQSFGSLGRPAWNTKKLRLLSILKLWELPNLERPQSFRDPRLKKIEASQHFGTLGASKHWEASILFRFGFKKIEASQYFGTLGAPNPGEASIFLGFKCKNAGRPQKTLMTQSFGSLGRPAWNTKKLRPLSILKLWELPNLERPQSFRDFWVLGPLNTLGLWELQNSERPQFCSGLDTKKLRPLNTLGRWELQNLERPQYFWGLNTKTLGGPKRL